MIEQIKLRQLSIGELILLAFQIFKRNYKVIALLTLMAQVPMYTIMSLLPAPDKMFSEIMSGMQTNMTYYAYAMIAVEAIFTPLFLAGLTTVCIQTFDEGKASMTKVLDNSLLKWSTLVIAATIQYATIVFTAILIVPAIYFGVCFAFAPNIIAMSEKKAKEALVISRRIVKRKFFTFLGVMLFTKLMSYVFGIVIVGALSLLLETKQFILDNVLYVVFAVISEFLTSTFVIACCLFFLNMLYVNAIQKKGKI